MTRDEFWYLSEKSHFNFPWLPSMVRNDGNYIISLGELCVWLAEQAEELGVDIFPGFSVSETIYNQQSQVIGVCMFFYVFI